MFVLVKLEFRQKIKCPNISEKRETRGKLPVEGGDSSRKGGEGEKGKPLIPRGKAPKKGLTGGAKRGKIISTLADTHINPCCY